VRLHGSTVFIEWADGTILVKTREKGQTVLHLEGNYVDRKSIKGFHYDLPKEQLLMGQQRQ
jgi:thiamine pyrophosphokinase